MRGEKLCGPQICVVKYEEVREYIFKIIFYLPII
jgi:hypothetical protein